MNGRIREWLHRAVQVFRRRSSGTEQDEEFASHLDLAERDFLRAGMSPHEARRAAALKFGSLASAGERVHDQRSLPAVESFLADARYALRGMRTNPGFTAVVLLTLALGIGVNTALFSLVHGILIEPMPYPQADRLVRIWSSVKGAPRATTALPDYREWRRRTRSFEDMGAYAGTSYNLTGGDRPERLIATRFTASVWNVLRVEPRIGRLFDSSDEEWGRHRVVVLSEAFWNRRFGADPNVLGRTLQLNGEPYTVIGVLPARSQFPGPLTELWAPLVFAPGDNMDSRNNYFSDVVARLKPQVSRAGAQQDMDAIAAQLAEEVPQNRGRGTTLLDLQEAYVGGIRPMLVLLFGSAVLVLLIACGNVASLLITRAAGRHREIAVRAALGAGRGRLIRQMTTESVVLSGFGAVLGLGVAYAVMRLLLYLAPPGLPRLQQVSLDGTVLAFTLGVSLVTGLIFGLWPAWQAARRGTTPESPRMAGVSAASARSRKILVVAQVALSLTLLIGANLLIASLMRVQQVNPGFVPERLLTMRVNLPRYTAERVVQFIQGSVANLSAAPGVTAAAATTSLPLGGSEWGKYFTVEGRPEPASMGDVPSINHRQITPGYFRAMGATILQGRDFTEQDTATGARVAIVNETNAKRFWPDGDPIGKRVWLLPPQTLLPASPPQPAPYASRALEVVGVVADMKTFGLEREPNPEVFVPLAQIGPEANTFYFFVARTAGNPADQIKAAEAAIHAVNKDMPVIDLLPMETRLANSFVQRRFTMFLLGVFAALALTLAMVGLYGLISYTVLQRTQEMGVRAALGAKASDLLGLVVREAVLLAGAGLLAGLVAAASLSGVIAGQLFEVRPVDPWLYTAAAAAILALAAVACWAPGRRAARTDPAITLRYN